MTKSKIPQEIGSETPPEAPVENKSTVGRSTSWSPLKFSLRQYALIVAGLLILAGGIALLAANSSTVSSATPANCFSSPGSCGYPDPAYHNVGVTDCSSLTPSGDINANTAGETISGKNVTGEIDVSANNVTITNDCVTDNAGSTTDNSSGAAIHVLNGATGLKITNSTVGGGNATNQSVQAAIANDITGTSTNTATGDYFLNCSECIHGIWTVNDSYVITNGYVEAGGELDHYEDWYFNDGSISANHDTMFNPIGQTAILFGDTNGGNGATNADNHLTMTNSFVGGGGFMFYPDSSSSRAGSSSMNVSNNRFARCLTTASKQSSDGGYACGTGGEVGGYSPGGGHYGLIAYDYSGPSQVWSCNFWDDNPINTIDESGDAIANTSPSEAPCDSGGNSSGGGTTTGGGSGTTTPPPPPADTTKPTVSVSAPASGTKVSGATTVTANASDNVGVASVQFEVDGSPVGNLVTTTPYSYSWNTTGVTSGTHTLSAIAKDAAGNTATASNVGVTVSNTTTDTTPPSVPTDVTGSATTSAAVNLTWKASTDNVRVIGYRVYRNGSNTALATITAPAASYKDTAVSANTAYTYTVAAVDAANNQSAKSAPSASIITPKAADTTPPSVPTALTTIATTDSSVSFTWEASKDNTGGSGVAGYHVYRSTTTDSAATMIASPSTNSYADLNLKPNTTYIYVVSAYDNDANGSAASTELKATTKAVVPPVAAAPPTAPGGLHSTATTSTTISVAWSPSTDSSSVGLAGYYIYRNGVRVGSPTGTTYTDAGLSSKTSYLYTVKAVDKAGALSAVSNSILAKTAAGKTPPPPKKSTKRHHHHHWWQFWEKN